MTERAMELGGHAQERIGHGYQRAMAFGSQAQEKIGHGYQVSRDEVVHQIDEHPLAAGGAALGLGLLAGYLLPKTRVEDAYLGEVADRVKDQAREAAERGKEMVQATGLVAMDQLKDQAKDLAQEAMDRGTEVVQATRAAALQEAEQHGLMPEKTGQHSEPKTSKESSRHSGGKEAMAAGQVGGTKEAESQSACAIPTPATPNSGTSKQEQSAKQPSGSQNKPS
jgi:hypothetical protein